MRSNKKGQMKMAMLGRMPVLTLSLLTALTVVLGSAAHAQPKKPNILIIWGDDITSIRRQLARNLQGFSSQAEAGEIQPRPGDAEAHGGGWSQSIAPPPQRVTDCARTTTPNGP